MSYQLTEGALATIMRGGTVDNPVMQILGSKKMGSDNSNERYRLLVSDGRHLNSFAMLATQLNEKVTSGELAEHSVVRINRHITSMISNAGKGEKRVMIILDLTVLAPGSEVGIRIGNPQPYDSTSTQSNSTQSTIKPAVPNRPIVNGTSNTLPRPAPPGGLTSSPGDIQRVQPISSINPYHTASGIKARVTSKTPIKTWSNARGEGKLFSLSLLDESGEIRATAFNQEVDRFFDLMEVNHIYYLSGFIVKVANKNFTSIKHDFEITFSSNTKVVPCHDDSEIPSTSFEFVPINKLAEVELNAVVDVIGVCKSTGDLQTFTARTTNKELKKRDVTITDQSCTSVTLTFWGQQAEDFEGSLQPVIAVKGGKINEFQGGRSVSLLQQSIIQLNPDIPEAHRLRGWFDNVGATQPTTNISSTSGASGTSGFAANWMTLKEAQDTQLGTGDKADYFTCKGTVMLIRSERATYKACPNTDCNKKVIDQGNSMYRCEKCNTEFPNFKYRMLLSISLGDWTSNQWVTCFQEVGEVILGISAQELGVLEDQNKPLYESYFKSACFKSFIFKIRAKMEFYNDERRVKMSLVQAKPVDYKEYNTHLLNEIREMSDIVKKVSI